MENEIEDAGCSIDPQNQKYSKPLADCVNQIAIIRQQMQLKIGGKYTYCLQKANFKFFDYVTQIFEIIDDTFFDTIVDMLKNDQQKQK